MKPSNTRDDLSTDSIPEMIQKLWALYREMAADPALASSACHIRSAVLALEDTRRMALEVYLEGQQHQNCAKAPKKTAQRSMRNARARKLDAAAEWLLSLPVASPLKN
jgi:hypothetical protein